MNKVKLDKLIKLGANGPFADHLSGEQLNQWVVIGMRLGYPECCMKDFLKISLGLSEGRLSKFDGTGYRPCVEHEKMSIMEVQSVMFKNGRPSFLGFPFPDDTGLDTIIFARITEEETVKLRLFFDQLVAELNE